MKKLLKILLWAVLSIVVVAGILMGGFIYKITHGFPVSYETEVPKIDFPEGKKAVLLFSKATGFRHGESIETGIGTFNKMASKNNWFLYSTEEGGVFNTEQLAKFDAVVFNNCTGRLLNEEQQKNFEDYVEQGGKLIGIHGAGDNSHHWDWYVKNLTGPDFSHHPLDPQFQQAEVILNQNVDSLVSQNLPAKWMHTDEWYVFLKNPRARGFTVVYNIDGARINPSGNMLWMKDKNFGMGKDHPVAWYKLVGNGKTFYTSMGHDAGAWKQPAFVQMLENAVNW